jgi:hypothetical protein
MSTVSYGRRPRWAIRTLFPAIVASAIVILIAPSYSWGKEVQTNNNAKIVFGQTNPVCLESIKIVRGLTRDDFWSGEWRVGFGEIGWLTGTYPTVSADGRYLDYPYKYVPIDIYNNDSTQVVVQQSDFFTSVNWDWMYVFQPDEFNRAQLEQTVEKLIGESKVLPHLNLQNTVVFTNGRNAVPTELHIWSRKGKNYLVMKENYFAREKKTIEGDFPQSLYVGILNGTKSSIFDAQSQYQRLHPKMICQLTWR